MKSTHLSSLGVHPALLSSLAIATVLGLSSNAVFAAAAANDTASNYSATWGTSPPNSGSGFGPWTIILQNANNPPYVGTYLDTTTSSVRSGGYAWATYANQGGNNGSISITRDFTAGSFSGSSSLFDQTFSVDLSSGGVGNGSGGPPNSELAIGVGNAFSFYYLGSGSDNFLLSVDGGTATTTPVNFSELGSGITFSLAVSGSPNSSSENYSLTVTPVGGGSAIYSTSGTFDSSAFNTSDFNYLDSNTANNGYFNNLIISTEVPEPSSMVLGASGLAMLLLLRRRR